eukprot:CAMPEP_0117441162 /NCGR_PEP_ID=MMETSP0759-20121206/3490_1 /TAXON_ID=63605 /ORGANISM="Percolomonas cosmopolitus, Strain WS" /LENGTH=478 /DNA_ID=CAMNT_0005233003 /DNA_START=151 /DNA_END=1587 /DNA_ORIENTATION=-
MSRLFIATLLFTTLYFISLASADRDLFLGEQLWAKYQVSLIKILQHKFPKLSAGVPQTNTILSIVSDPMDAQWYKSKFHLNEEFALYAPKYSSKFDYISMAGDRTIPKMYEKMLMTCKNPKAFMAFRNSPKDSFPNKGATQSYPWEEPKESLSSFVKRIKSSKNYAVHFIVEENKGQTSINSPWFKKTGPVTHAGGFVKEVQKENKDDDLLILTDEDVIGQQQDEDSFLFGRRRRRSAPVKIQTVVIKSQKFKVDFQAKGITGITLRPGKWFDKNVLRSCKSKLSAYFGKNGKMPCIPQIAWVAYQPHVTVELSESEWHKYQHAWKNPRTIGLSFGGVLFRTNNFRQKIMDDDDVSEEKRAFYANDDFAAMHADEVQFTVEDRDMSNDDDDSAPLADEASFTVVEKDDDESELDGDDLLAMNEAMDDDEDGFLFRRRRRRRRYVPPPPPRKVYEKVYKATFKSTDPDPQIIAVTSEIL